MGGLYFKVLLHHRRDARIRFRGRRGFDVRSERNWYGLLDGHLRIVLGRRKLANFVRASQSIATRIPVFHPCKAALSGETVD